MICLAAGAVSRGKALEGREGLYLFPVQDERDPSVWYVCVSSDWGRFVGEGAVALTFSMEVPEGGCILSCDACDGAEGLTLTVGRLGNRSVNVLLDGSVCKSETEGEGAVCLLRVTVGRSEETGITEGRLLISVGQGSNGYVYYINNWKEIDTYTLLAGEAVLSDSNTTLEAPSNEGDSSEARSEIDTDIPDTGSPTSGLPVSSVPDTDGEVFGTSATEDTADVPSAVFIGCQETPVREESFSVRFLFLTDGEGGGAPVICMEGGGVLSMEVSSAQTVIESTEEGTVIHEADGSDGAGIWTICTFRGLSDGRTYRFLVYTSDGIVQIVYDRGRYVRVM